MAVPNVDPYGLLCNLGIDPEKVWTDKEDRAIYLFSEDWEKIRLYFNWSPLAKTGFVDSWAFGEIPDFNGYNKN